MSVVLKNDRLIKALLRKPVDRTPVWMMRQAGRYLPEYRKTREKAGDFLSLCKNTELACEVTLQPLARYPLDAAILFSDILTIPDAMGLGLYFAEGEGPKFRSPIKSASDVQKISTDVLSELGYVMDAVSMIRRELAGQVPLIGFTGSPWTLATYMIEGRSTREFKLVKGMMYDQPDVMHQLLEKLAIVVRDYLNAQIDAGAQVVQIFDTWGGVLSDAAYLEFSLNYMQKIIDGLKKTDAEGNIIPIIVFTKGGAPWLDRIASTGCHAIGLDWSVDIGSMRGRISDSVALQGNMDPAVLRASPSVIEQEVKRILECYGQHHDNSGHVFNLGHGVTPDINPDNVAAYIEAVVKHSGRYH